MQLYPAVDMKSGQCVRLRQGAFKDITIYPSVPEKVAAHWQEKGVSPLHLVDLDGALTGYSVNEETIHRITDTAPISIEIGDGIRFGETVERILGLGVRHVIIGIKAVEYPESPRDIVKTLGEEVVMIGVDVRDGMVAVKEWEKVSSLTIRDLRPIMKEHGVRYIVYIDVSGDRMLSGPNVEVARKLTEKTGPGIIAPGGIFCMEDLKCLHEAGIRGAIIGKAPYAVSYIHL